jgi:predicted dehydrogenase
MAEGKKLRVGIIGIGFGLRTQLPALRAAERVEVVAIASSSADKAKQVAAEQGIAAGYGDYREMLVRERLDLVCIATPPYLHHEMVLAVAAAGVNIICEKPFALNAGEARAMLAAVEQAGFTAAIDHEFRYLPARHYMKALVAQGYLGDVYLIAQSDLSGSLLGAGARPWDWWMQREKGGGLLGAIGSHFIDTIRWMFGDIEAVCAQVDTYVKQRPMRGNPGEHRAVTSDDSSNIIARMVSGAELHMQFSGLAPGGKSELCAYGSGGGLALDTRTDSSLQGVKQGEGQQMQPLDVPAQYQLPDIEGGRLVAPFGELISRVVTAIDGGHPTAWEVASFADGVAVQRVLDAVRRSADEHRWVNVSEV